MLAFVIRLVSYNIHKGIGLDRLRRPERILDVLAEMSPDIVVLQEADRRLGARRTALPLPQIEAHGFHAIPFDTRPESIGWHGNAILVRKRATITGHALIPLPALEPRGAVMADIRIDGKALRIIGMHLDLSGLWRRRQVHAILAAADAARPQMRTVLAGDLNEWSPHGGCLPEFTHEYRIAWTQPSFHTRRPVARLDRIMIGDGLSLIGSGTHHSPKARRASDHLPVWAEFGFL
jgi:endonuclease/exonuclease/phosphatase family metal-dependent hydrolase